MNIGFKKIGHTFGANVHCTLAAKNKVVVKENVESKEKKVISRQILKKKLGKQSF